MPQWFAFVLLFGSLQPAVPTDGAPLLGGWTGSWARDSDTLAVTMHFVREPAGWAGSFDSERLRVTGIPLSDITVTPPRLTWKIVGDSSTMTFAGALDGDILAGEFEEKGARGTFRLTRMDQEAPSVRERDFHFRNGDVALTGTLLLPGDSVRKAPAVVFSHGSGAEGRWASKYLATRFARAGVAALIFDKRGAGESGGDWRKATYDDLAGDVAAAVEALRKSSLVDASRVGIHGHSQGGTLAPLVAAKSGVAFVIASAAAGLPLDEVEIYSLENSVNVNALSAEDAALAKRYIDAVVGVAYRGEPRERLASVSEEVKGKPWVFQQPPAASHYWAFSLNFNTFDPVSHWRNVTAPVLLVYGEADKRVPPRLSAARIMQAIFEGAGHNASAQIFPDADHSFRVRSPGLVWPSTVSGYPDSLIEWTTRITGISSK